MATPAPPPPPIIVDLAWTGQGERLIGRAGSATMAMDVAGSPDPTPVQTLAFALAGCMGMDILDILVKGRLPVQGLILRLTGERVADPPRRFTGFELHVVVTGAVPPDRVERALALSVEKYCSVWHSLRQDLGLRTSFEVLPAEPGPASPGEDQR
jgi:putative redox protein